MLGINTKSVVSEREVQCGGEVTDSSSDLQLRRSLSVTFLDRGDASARGVPGRLEAKVLAAVGLLVQADAHLAVVLLRTKQQQLNMCSRDAKREREREQFGKGKEIIYGLVASLHLFAALPLNNNVQYPFFSLSFF